MRRFRRAFTLLEAIIAVAIIFTTLLMAVSIQHQLVVGHTRARRMLTATWLAQQKLAETLVRVEATGVTGDDLKESGDFKDMGEGTDVELGHDLDAYHFEVEVSQVDLQLSGEVTQMLQDLAGGLGEEGGEEAQDAIGQFDLSALGITDDMLSEEIARYLREVRVRVYWVEDRDSMQASEEAAEAGNEVVLVTHIASPSGAFDTTTAEEGGE